MTPARHSVECDCTLCHYSKKHPQVPHHALCGCFSCTTETRAAAQDPVARWNEACTKLISGQQSASPHSVHELKIAPEFFEPVRDGRKPFEVRVADRPFRVDDILHFREADLLGNYSGRECRKRVTYILRGWGVKDGRVCLGLTDVSPVETAALSSKQRAVLAELIRTSTEVHRISDRATVPWFELASALSDAWDLLTQPAPLVVVEGLERLSQPEDKTPAEVLPDGSVRQLKAQAQPVVVRKGCTCDPAQRGGACICPPSQITVECVQPEKASDPQCVNESGCPSPMLCREGGRCFRFRRDDCASKS